MGIKNSSDVVTVSRGHQLRRNRWNQFIPSTTSALLVIYFILTLLMNGGFKPLIRRGFFCNDSSIKYPVKTDTVSFKWLIVIALIVPCIVIKICDRKLTRLLHNRVHQLRNNAEKTRRSRKKSDISEGDDVEAELLMTSPEGTKMRLVVNDVDSDYEAPSSLNDTADDEVVRFSREAVNGRHPEVLTTRSPKMIGYDRDIKSLSHVKLFFFGFVTTAFFTGIGKMSGGRLRPHFMERCKPDIDCSSPDNMYRYIEDFNCTNNLRPRDLSYISTSWPSGHASMIFFSMLYLILYLETVITAIGKASASRNHNTRFLDPIIIYSIYVMMIGLAGYISLTRVSDYHHHPTDVLSGVVLGSIMAIVMSKYELKPRLAAVNFNDV